MRRLRINNRPLVSGSVTAGCSDSDSGNSLCISSLTHRNTFACFQDSYCMRYVLMPARRKQQKELRSALYGFASGTLEI